MWTCCWWHGWRVPYWFVGQWWPCCTLCYFILILCCQCESLACWARWQWAQCSLPQCAPLCSKLTIPQRSWSLLWDPWYSTEIHFFNLRTQSQLVFSARDRTWIAAVSAMEAGCDRWHYVFRFCFQKTFLLCLTDDVALVFRCLTSTGGSLSLSHNGILKVRA